MRFIISNLMLVKRDNSPPPTHPPTLAKTSEFKKSNVIFFGKVYIFKSICFVLTVKTAILLPAVKHEIPGSHLSRLMHGFIFPWVTCDFSCCVLHCSGCICSTDSCNHCLSSKGGFFRRDRPFWGCVPLLLQHVNSLYFFLPQFLHLLFHYIPSFFLLTLKLFPSLNCKLKFLRSFPLLCHHHLHPHQFITIFNAWPNRTRSFFIRSLCVFNFLFILM